MLTPQNVFESKTEANKVFKDVAKNKGNNSVLEIITFNNEYIINLMESGVCSIHNRLTKTVIFFNKSKDELIRSIFHNRLNESIIVVSVTKRDEFNSLKCRTVKISLIEKAFHQALKTKEHR
mmetsp:Transcript_10700/g.10818  ORF Transcript_10700/g.10818 Transcript_10700/m.10818 type:complete len:122 (+) Transcript_10700:142-507(+)